MYVLGLSSYTHEASCALIKDGVIRAVAEEERFNRKKHTWDFPAGAIDYCLRQEGITAKDIDHFTFFWQPWREFTGNITHFLRYFPESLGLFQGSSGGGDLNFLGRVKAMQSIGKELQRHLKLEHRPKVNFIEHHLSHAASAFFVSPFEEAAILTIDGRGESTSTMLSVGRGNKIEKIKSIHVPHSMGHFYASITDYLGFRPFFDEWKVMGMSAYGTPKYCKDFEELVHLKDNGEYRLNLDYFSFHVKGASHWLSPKFHEKFGPKITGKEVFSEHSADIAFALQRLVEKVGVHLARHLQKTTGLKNLCMTGGVSLNCLMNKRIMEETDFENFFIQPVANDAGTSLGSALYHYHHNLNQPRATTFSSVYWGPEFSNDEIEAVLREKGVKYTKETSIARAAAKRVAEGKILGWFQGRMECGPRALGNRSIVADPTSPTMKDRLNARVKRREGFRPFAPSVLEEEVTHYFDLPKKQLSPYMILVGDVKPEMREKIPAVTHADFTARVHTVNRDINPRYWELIQEFKNIKGVPLVINTSFNENEPIVCNPREAVDCFLRTDFDSLAIGDFLLDK